MISQLRINERVPYCAYYQIERWDKNPKNGHYSWVNCTPYPCNNIDIIHNTQEFKLIKSIDRQDIPRILANELLDNFSEVVDELRQLLEY